MARAICVNCKNFRHQNMFPASWCHSPNAVAIDRVRGDLYPRIDPALSDEDAKRIKVVTDKCDSGGWFQERRPWWVF